LALTFGFILINRYTVIGQPIAHSLSPIIHQLFGELTQRKIHYTRTEASPETFADTVINWQDSGGRGCNVTMPFKEQAHEVCDRLSVAARLAGSVNTIHMHKDGSRIGHNTDGLGLLADFKSNLRWTLANRNVLLIGAGGASRGVVGPLLDAAPATLWIANRTASRATELAEYFKANHTPKRRDAASIRLDGGGMQDVPDAMEFDIVINASSASLLGDMPDIESVRFAKQACAYDMMYGNADTPFTSWAKSHNMTTSNGFGMLIEQAADAFLFWEGVRPKTRMAYPRLRELLAQKYQ